MNMNNIIKKIFFLLIIFSLAAFFVPIYATTCTNPITSSCTFANTIDGFDAGSGSKNTATLTINNGATLTILAGQSIAVGKVVLNTGGAIAIINTGKLKIRAHLYLTDADADGYPASTTYLLSGGVIANLVAHPTQVDCCDSNGNAHPPHQTTTYYPNPMTGGCSGYDYDCDSSTEQQYTVLYSCSTSGCDAYHSTVTTGFNGSVPACGGSSADNYYTATTPGNCADTACNYTTSTVTQACN
jgi:hypothetical protein